MALYTTLASLSQTAASNVADGAVDAPSTIDQQTNLLASFIAQLRDGNGLTTGVGYLGQCRLVKSGSNLVLQRYNGVGLTINGVAYAIPSAGVSLAPTGSAGTTYYIYAYMSAGTMTLEASTTTHATDSTTGIEIKSGDATRTLVGMARPTAGPAWTDSAAQRFVISWFNPQPIYCLGFFTANRTVVAAGYTDLNAEIRNEFLTWANKAIVASANGGISHSVAGSLVRTCVGVDGGANDGFSGATCNTAGSEYPIATYLNSSLSEGYHYTTLLVNNTTGAGTATCTGSGTPATRCAVQTVIQG